MLFPHCNLLASAPGPGKEFASKRHLLERLGRRVPGGLMTLLLLAFSPAPAPAAPDFSRDVRPILERSCFGCHGPEKQKSGYRLDRRDLAMKGGDSGNPAIVAHNARSSPSHEWNS